MTEFLIIVALLCFIIDLVVWFLVLKHTYTQGRFWSLVFCFLLFPYLFFYALVDFEHEHKKVILLIWFSAMALSMWIPHMVDFPEELR